MRIGQKLTWGFVSIASLVIIVGYVCIYTSQEALQKSIGDNSVMLAQETLDKIDRDIYNQIERWKSYCATNVRLKEITLFSNQEFEKMDNIQGYINEKDQECISVPKEVTTPFMEELINNRLSQQLRNRMDFYEREYGHKVIGELFLTNKYGANIAQTGKTTDYYQADEQWWQKAKQDGIYVVDVEYDRSADVYSTDIGIRIDDENGHFLGVMKVVLSIEEVTNILEKLKKTTKHGTLEFHLINREGKVIYSSGETHQHKVLEDISHEDYFKGIKGDTGHFIIKENVPREEERFVVYAHSRGFKDFKSLGWVLAIDYQAAELFAPIITLRKVILSISLMLTML
ncbi:cache domain-containing protein, partial [bacterium]|nr:cache domain-containing protein [bacterium]